ncbi:hypothetical protein LFYK43_00130 [Ligilactobacillus salitolerans]|uniref:Polyketide cyclase n=1 Tax=Ligilactobacillus salitolerans TaxID=1808352 RepID=A0A401IPX3_9LACO|nr:SRPBCC family protein [Ligilactobacillus salitolerans]GBG93554.1 hypothetical protein LFYK43_00130 [Ligilactobacillus salitolerans]
MQQKLFSNVVVVGANQKQVWQFLINPQHLSDWAPSITLVGEGKSSFTISRAEAALNQHEVISVEETEEGIKYTSTEGRLEYEVFFSIVGEGNQTTIQEDVYIPEKADLYLPVKLLTPIAKHAFNVNLNNLASLVKESTRLEK